MSKKDIEFGIIIEGVTYELREAKEGELACDLCQFDGICEGYGNCLAYNLVDIANLDNERAYLKKID